MITGEDRFLAYSLMCGAQAALIGMAAACTGSKPNCWTPTGWRAARFLALMPLSMICAAHVPLSDGRLYPANALVPRASGSHPGGGRLTTPGDPRSIPPIRSIGGCLARLGESGQAGSPVVSPSRTSRKPKAPPPSTPRTPDVPPGRPPGSAPTHERFAVQGLPEDLDRYLRERTVSTCPRLTPASDSEPVGQGVGPAFAERRVSRKPPTPGWRWSSSRP